MSSSPILRPLLASLVAFALYVGAGLYLIQLERQSWLRDDLARAEISALQYGAAIERVVDRAMLAAESMESFIQHHDGEVRDFETHSADLIAGVHGARALELAPGGVISHIYPPSRYRQFLGRTVAAPGGTEGGFVQGPMELDSGESLIVARYPVRIEHGGAERPWGFASVYIPIGQLVREVHLERLAELGYRYRLRDPAQRVVAGQLQPADAAPSVVVPVELPGQAWSLALVRVRDGGHATVLTLQLVLLVASGAILAYLVFTLFWRPLLLRRQVDAATRALGDSNARYDEVFNAIREVVFQTDADARLTLLNPAWYRVTGHPVRESLDRALFDYLHPDDLERGRELFALSLDRPGEPLTAELRLRSRDGEVRWVELDLRAHVDGEGAFTGFAGSLRDVTDRKQADRLIHYQANYDALTNLPNRKLFLDRFGRAIESAVRNRRRLALMFIDLDRFKWVNDTLGHASGDRILKETARRLNACVRKADTVARFGGDEFVVLLTEIGGASDAEVVASKILAALEKPFKVDGHEEIVGGSIGITLCPDDGTDRSVLMNNADNVMYLAKQSGRNTFRFFTTEMNRELQERHRMALALRRALDDGDLRLDYQPIEDLGASRTVGIEALLRWESPEFGNVAPPRVVALSEDTRLHEQLGRWVIGQACRDFLALQETNPDLEYVTVNVSTRQFRTHLLDDLPETLAGLGIRPDEFCFDIDESLLSDDRSEVWQTLDRLHALGVRIMLDDFGTGLSSLAILQRLRPDAVKVQNTYLSGIVPEASAAAMLGAIIAMAHSMDIAVVGEGVEEPAQLEMLRLLGCDCAQGYVLCRPYPARELDGRFAAAAAAANDELGAASGGSGSP